MAAFIPTDMEVTNISKNKHFTFSERSDIERGLNNGDSFKKIGRDLGKDCTTIAKEVKKHIQIQRTGASGIGFNDCALAHNHQCSKDHLCDRCVLPGHHKCWACGRCTTICSSYIKYTCPKLEKAPYVCNACPDRRRCNLEKHLYQAKEAQAEYQKVLSESRTGFDLTEQEVANLDKIVSPLLKKGQSLNHILLNHADEVMKSQRSMYRYVDAQIFTARNIDMPRKVKFRPRKKLQHYYKVDKKCRIGRVYNDFLKFKEEHHDLRIRELDSVEGIEGGAVLLTIEFSESGLQLAYRRDSNDSQSVIDIFDWLYNELGPDVFSVVFPVILADNGGEFSNPMALEFDKDGNQRTRVFYCEPNAPYEKPHCERNHEEIRRCIPKGVDIGQYTQEQISLMMSHINSYARPSLNNKSPYDIFSYMYSEDVLRLFGLKRIPADEITLTPAVFKL